MDKAKAMIETDLEERIRNANDKVTSWHQHQRKLRPLLDELEETKVQLRWDGDLIISLTGSRADLVQVWKILRAKGWVPPTERPKANESYWSAFFRHPDFDCKPAIYLAFSSEVCRRVKIRTELKEVDIYETICGDGDPLNQEASDELQF